MSTIIEFLPNANIMPVQPLKHTFPHPPGVGPSKQRPVYLTARDLHARELLKPHSHTWGQLSWTLDGVIRVTVENTTWIVPPSRAIWIPVGVTHTVEILEKARVRALHVYANAVPFRGKPCVVLDVSPLLRELIIALGQADELSSREKLISNMLLDEISLATTLPLGVALPTDKRLKVLCESLIVDPSLTLTLNEWAQRVGASERTLARLFEQDVGMKFGQWRQQMRLAHAAPLIASGRPLSQVAAELGYTSQSAFSAMFKKTFGQSPSAFFSKNNS
jgi:AraC-like DNA-binding protein/mannose-6-phosphate isomerase-like protein (cupin superfamily)